ncbi:MAG: class I SAM-dependent methyltransferase [Planctomycetes bacterium]|nr:class I SAM-dependent methyltransferase [Planctomycetota bacterium]
MKMLAAALLALALALLSAGQGGEAPDSCPLVLALDADGDGTLSRSEVEGASAALLGLDSDGDGALSPEEYGRARPAAGRTPEAASRILAVLGELNQDRGGNMNVPEEDGRLLRLLAEAAGARNAVEIGTSNGYSGLWISLALCSTGGSLTTFEIDPERAQRAHENFAKAGVADLVTIVLGDAHEEVLKLREPIDVLFLDADKPGYVDYLEKLKPLIRPGGLVLAHNMRRPEPDPRFIEAITTDPELETLFLHMEDAGMAVTLKKR